MNLAGDAELLQALLLSQQILAAAEAADLSGLGKLDERRQGLVHSFRSRTSQATAADMTLIRRIQDLNDKAIGLIEHHRRAMERDMDMVRAGRRAVAAYGNTRRMSFSPTR